MKFNVEDFRAPNEDFYKMSGCYGEKLVHTPYIILCDEQIKLCFGYYDLKNLYPPDTQVLFQWGGKWRSDFFALTVGQLIDNESASKKQDYENL